MRYDVGCVDREIFMNIEQKLTDLGLELPDPVAPAGSYLVGYVTGNLLFMSAVGPRAADQAQLRAAGA